MKTLPLRACASTGRAPWSPAALAFALMLVSSAVTAQQAPATAPAAVVPAPPPGPSAQPPTSAPDAARDPQPQAAPSSRPTASGRPRIGVALSGGGARGFAHVGVLRALEAMRVPVDCIAGTSAGSAVGAAYASGLSPDEIERALRSVDWDRDMFDDAPPRRDQQMRRRSEERSYLLDLTVGLRDGSLVLPSGLISGQKIEMFLHRMLGVSTVLASFDALPIPFRAMATDLESGEMVAQDRGNLATAVRASMAVPSVFAPVSNGGRLLVDGGLTRNMPVDIVRGMCADIVIAVDIGGPLLKRDELGNPFGIASQMVGILMERNMRESRAEVRSGVDVMLRPELGDIGSTSFGRGVDGIPAGERAALDASAELARLALDADTYARWQAERAQRRVGAERYTAVRVIGTTPSIGRSLLAHSDLQPSGELDRRLLDRTINNWNSSGDFERIGYSLIPEGSGANLVIDVVEHAWGPNYLRFGLGASGDSKNNGVFNLLLGFRRPRFTPWGGEFRAQTQFGSLSRATFDVFQPFNDGLARAFVNPSLLLEEVPLWLFLGSDRIAEFGIRTVEGVLDLGVQGSLGDVRIGVLAGARESNLRTGLPLVPQRSSTHRGVRASLVADQLDALDFPREGYLVGVSGRREWVESDFGEQFQAWRAQFVARLVGSWGPHTVSASARVGEASDRVDIGQYFSLGGFMNVSSLQLNQVLGRSLRYASLVYQNQLMTLPSPLGRGVYAGIALEAASVQRQLVTVQGEEWFPSITGYLGIATAVGPVYLGYGVSRDNRLLYLFLGRPSY